MAKWGEIKTASMMTSEDLRVAKYERDKDLPDTEYKEDVWPLEEAKEPAFEGLKFDNDKVRLELIPSELLFAVGTILTFGAKKYADRNWELGMNWSRPFGALMRHMWYWWAGRGPTTKSFLFGDLDDETGKSHLWHAGCCIAFLIAYEERGVGKDDRPT